MFSKVTLVIMATLVCVQTRDQKHRRPRLPRRFPKPDTWMLYSSKYDPKVEESGCTDLRGPLCSVYAKNPGYCYHHLKFMKKFCYKSCRWCDPVEAKPEKSFAESQPNGGVGIVNGLANGGCEDLIEDCSKYIQKPEDCEEFSDLSKKYCARTCGHCCSDQIQDCSVFIKHISQCNRLNGFFRKYCSYTCKICGPPIAPVKRKDCVDKLSECRLFKQDDCKAHPAFCLKNCPKSCGYCESLDSTTVKPLTYKTNVNAKATKPVTFATNARTNREAITSFVEPVKTTRGSDIAHVTMSEANFSPSTETVATFGKTERISTEAYRDVNPSTESFKPLESRVVIIEIENNVTSVTENVEDATINTATVTKVATTIEQDTAVNGYSDHEVPTSTTDDAKTATEYATDTTNVPLTESTDYTTDADKTTATEYATDTTETATEAVTTTAEYVTTTSGSASTSTVSDISVPTSHIIASETGKTYSPITQNPTHATENSKTNLTKTQSLTHASESGETTSPVTVSASESVKTEHVLQVTANPLTFTDRSKPRSISSASSSGGKNSVVTFVNTGSVVTPTTEPERQKDVPEKKPTKNRNQNNKSTTKARSVSCVDRLSQCARLVSENPNSCKAQVNYMKEYCKKSCNFCEPTVRIPKCVDRRKRKCKLYSKFQGYCTVHRQYMADVCPKSCGFCGVSPDELEKRMSYYEYNKKHEFAIKTKWNGNPINHDPIKIKLSAEDNLNVRLEVSGPFFDQPGKPPCLAGKPCWELWNYEVAEVFFLGEKEKYLELEVSPHGPHLLLLLDGVRKPFKTKLPMRYSATIDHVKKTWNGTAIVPLDYFPPNMRKINAYAIHGPDNQKVYESLYPAKNSQYPDFHQLQFFGDLDFKSMFPQGWKQPMSPFWIGRIY